MDMDPITVTTIAVFIAELIAAPIIVGIIGRKLNKFDEKREQARHERAEDKRYEREQRDAESKMILAIARTMLLNNYEKCLDKGYYSLDERDVYSLLYEAYKKDNGNGVIDSLAEKIRRLPTEPPEDEG